jgi:hypothetical protein
MSDCPSCEATGFEYRPNARASNRTLHRCHVCDGATTVYRTELTPAGEQMVIPGCERDAAPGVRQLSLF